MRKTRQKKTPKLPKCQLTWCDTHPNKRITIKISNKKKIRVCFKHWLFWKDNPKGLIWRMNEKYNPRDSL